MLRLIPLLLLILGFGVHAGVDELAIDSDLQGKYILAIVVHDQRPQVLRGEATEATIGSYAGSIFSPARKPTLTNSEQALAESLAEGLRKSFMKHKWLGVAVIPTKAGYGEHEILDRIRRGGSKRSLLITIDKLWAESQKDTEVDYRLRISVRNQRAQELAKAVLEMNRIVRDWGDDAVANVLSTQLTALLARPEFIAALKD